MQLVAEFLSGQPSASTRVWGALAPGLTLLALLVVSFAAYVVRSLVLGDFHDEEMERRGLGGLLTARIRHFFAWLMRPFWRALVAAEVPPNAITTLSVAFGIGSGIAAAAGRFSLAGWVFLFAGALDFLDGRVARVTGRASRAGAALDSVLDRYCESALLVGLAWYYRGSWTLLVVLLALTGSFLVPYVRARGEALGATLRDVGVMQRPERIILLGSAVALAPILEVLLALEDRHPPHRLAVAGLVLLAITSHGTALQRLAHLVRALGHARPPLLRRFPHSVATSVVATLVDFVLMRGLHVSGGAPLPAATLLGCLAGGTTAFFLSRFWVFHAAHQKPRRQIGRFAFVSGTSALLNAGGVAVLLLLPGLAPSIVWIVARVLVFVCWNFPLLGEWAFEARRDEVPPGAPAGLEDDLEGKSAPGTS